ncbi:MAG: gliding motility-associated C-terminal domain-containing protein, partial [bacterium]|nr:gliding motility-associated C-terminal domain-containing protein [bacterium]
KIDIGMVIVDEDDVYREEKGTISDKIFSKNQSSLMLEDEEKEEENIAPLAYLIINIPQSSRVSNYQRTLEQIMSCISIDGVELKDADENVIGVQIDKGNITKVQPELNLDKVYCYPNPTKEGWIKFAKLTQTVKVRIFNIAGELIYEREHPTNGEWEWQCIDNNGKKVASGIYIYILKDPVSGSMKKGKLGIVR